MGLLILALICCTSLCTSVCAAEDTVRLNVSPVDGREDVFNVSYKAPSSSIYAAENFTDTVYCAAIISTSVGNRNAVVPMRRTSGSDYTCLLELPPLTYQIRIEICIPTDRVPDGIEIFYYKRDADLWQPSVAMKVMQSNDSALTYERLNYPENLYVYYQYWNAQYSRHNSDSSTNMSSREGVTLDSIIQVVKNHRAKSFNRYFTLSLLYELVDWKNPHVALYLDSAVQAQLRDRTAEPLLYDHGFWNNYYYPTGHLHWPEIASQREVGMQNLAAAYPRSLLGTFWIERARNSRIETKNIRTVIDAWTNSYDVDVLSAIGHRLISTTSGYTDAQLACQILKRAEKSSAEYIGFRNGENIFGSMGRLDRVRSALIKALSILGRHTEAIETGKKALLESTTTYGTQALFLAMAEAHFGASDMEASKQFLSNAIGGTSRRAAMVIDSLYAFDGKSTETKLEYVERLLIEYSQEIHLPEIPDFRYTTLTGKRGSLLELHGKIVFIDFWFLGCAGCALEHQSLNDFARRYASDSNVVFLSVALNNTNALQQYLKKSPLLADVIPDGQSICDTAKVTGFPTHVILDQTGKTVLWEMGGSKDTGERLSEIVQKMQKK